MRRQNMWSPSIKLSMEQCGTYCCKTGTLPGDPFSRILPKLRMKEIEESVKKLKLDGSFSSKQCLSSSREDGFITQVKGEDYANCFALKVF